MRVTCHQPHFLPWIPYWNRIAHSDLFLVLDDVSFRKNYFHNRTIVRDKHNLPFWVTIPIRRAHLGTPISDITVCRSSRAMQTSINRLREAYRPYATSVFLNRVLAILENPPARLIDLNISLIKMILRELGLSHVEIALLSKVVDGSARGDRLLAALKAVQASHVIVGMGGMAAVNDLSNWRANGIALDFQRSQEVPEDCSLAIGHGISVLHDIIILGSARTASLVRRFWTPELS